MSAWISVKERLPPKGVDVMGFHRRFLPEACYNMSGYWYSSHDHEPREISHWQPLPEPPEESK